MLALEETLSFGPMCAILAANAIDNNAVEWLRRAGLYEAGRLYPFDGDLGVIPR